MLEDFISYVQESVAAKADDAEEKAHDIDASPVVQERKRGVDPFKFEESDPMKSDAMSRPLSIIFYFTL